MKRRRGMALAVTIGVVSLIAILAVATLSLAARLVQDSSLGIRGAKLDGAAAYGMATAMQDWRQRSIGRLAVGATITFPVVVPGVPVTTIVSVTRVAHEVFWVVAESGVGGVAMRRENLVLRRRVPDPQSVLAQDSTNVSALGFLDVDSLAAAADLVAPAGAVLSPSVGVVHVAGSATILGGKGSGILVVDGVLTIAGSLEFTGIIVAKGGTSITSSGVSLTGLVRTPAFTPSTGAAAVSPSAAVVEDVMAQSLMPLPVRGRRWSELY